MRRAFGLLLVLTLAPGCITAAEYRANVKAWRAFHDAAAPDLREHWKDYADIVKTNREKFLRDDDLAIRAAEKRAGITEGGADDVPATATPPAPPTEGGGR